MNDPITFIPSEAWANMITIAGGLVTLWALIKIVGELIRLIKKPERKQDDILTEHGRLLAEHSDKLKELDMYLSEDKDRLDDIDEASRVTQKALLALLAHAINGNDVDGLKAAKKALEEYLTNK